MPVEDGRSGDSSVGDGVPVLAPVPPSRLQEFEQIRDLLMDSAADRSRQTAERAEWIARSALEPGHLWRAMGVQDRSEVRRIMKESFPSLEAANDRDMRWKKFLYKRLCGWSGFNA